MTSKLRTHVHRRVLTQLVILGLVCAGLIVSVGYDAVQGEVNLLWVAVALCVGIGAGFVVGRIFKLAWHEETRKVVMNLDKTSIILVVAYIAFRIYGDQFLGHYVQGVALSALTFSLLAGILLGRLFSVWRGVRRILIEKNVW